MNIARMYTIALGSFGYTEDEARFLYLVAAHSGYFTCQQFLRFIDGKPGKQTPVVRDGFEQLDGNSETLRQLIVFGFRWSKRGNCIHSH